MANAFLFFLLLIFFSACNQSERSSLLSFGLTLSSPQLNWTSADCCNWEGITCNQAGWITHLQLPSKQLKLKGGTFLSSSLGNLTYLIHLNLSHNSLDGSLYQSTGFFLSSNHLEILDLSYNLLSGELPSSFFQNDIDLELAIYGYRGATLLQYKLSYFPPAIYVENNTINGDIPTEIGQLQLLHTLSLSNNNFSGNIPEQMSNLKNLEVLDLSMNHLSGKIPSSLASLHFLSSFNVSYNNLEGKIPTSTQLQSFNATAFEGNPNLCGAPLSNECLQNPKKGNEEDNNNNHDHLNINGQQIPWISVVLGFTVGFLGVCVMTTVHMQQRRSS